MRVVDYRSGKGVRMAALLLSIAVCFSMAGCDREEKEVLSPAAEQVLRNLPRAEMVESEEGAARRKIGEEAVALLRKGDFKTLDERAHEIRQAKRMYSNGTWELRAFYTALQGLDEDASDRQWTERLDLFKSWMKGRPASITPRVALAEALVGYAWKARGSGYADTVTREGGKLMDQRLAQAREILFQARSLEEKCPRWWIAAQTVALGEGWDAATYNKMCDEGLQRNPDNYGIYFTKAYFLQPRWYGKQGEWEKFAADSAAKLGGEDGEVLYARIVWFVHNFHIYESLFTESTLKWDRVKRSFEALDRRFPNSLPVMSQFARLACNAGDCITARKLFERIGGRVDKDEWAKVEDFNRFRRDAFAGSK